MRPSFRSAGLIAGALFLAACAGPEAGAAATVNGETIAMSTVERQVRAQVDDPSSQLSGATGDERVQGVSQLQNQVLTALIRLRIVDQLASEQGITVSEEEIQQEWDRVVENQTEGEQGLRDLLERLGITEEEAREQLRIQVAQTKLQEQVTAEAGEVSDDELRQAYRDRAAQYEVADVAHILVETEQEAQEILDELDSGASFAQLAEARSTDSGSAAQGGELGTVPLAQLVPEFSEAVRNAPIGEVVGPVQTQFGFHLIRVDSYEQQSFEDVEEDLRSELSGTSAQEALNALFEAAVSEAEVEVASRFGTWNVRQASVVASEAVGSPQSPQPSPPGQ